MTAAPHDPWLAQLQAVSPKDPLYATSVVNLLLRASRASGASDLHIQPTRDGQEIRWRIDGVLHDVALLSAELAPNVVARLKVLAGLLTYRTDVPQEGRIPGGDGALEVRVCTFPTLYGEKVVVRLFGAGQSFEQLDELGLGTATTETLRRLLSATSGAVLVTGPAGSGKSTTIYACLREVVRVSAGARSIVSLEDPIEVAVAGVAQTQVQTGAEFDLAQGLKFVLRQDPEVIMVGEIRDRPTAEVAFQASLTGHLILSTFHATSAAGAVSRLCDMGIAPYLLRSGVLAILSQRLARRLCHCARPATSDEERLALPVARAWLPVGCQDCRQTGYAGRMVLSELLLPEPGDVGRAILSRTDAARIEELAVAAGMETRWQAAMRAIEARATSPAEVRRVLGFSDPLPRENG